MRFAALLVAFIAIVIGIVGLVSPDTLMTFRGQYLSTPGGLYAAGAVRLAMGLVLILSGPGSRAPRTLRVLGAVMCLQGLAPIVIGTPDRALAVLEWEATWGTAALRVGATIALATGTFVAFAVTPSRRRV